MVDAIEIIAKDGSYIWIVRKNRTSLMSVVIMMEIVSGSLLHILQGHCSSFLNCPLMMTVILFVQLVTFLFSCLSW